MKIITPGDPGRLSKSRRFSCEDCGCVFIANSDEYRREPDYRNGTMLVCKCPTCGRDVYRDEQ